MTDRARNITITVNIIYILYILAGTRLYILYILYYIFLILRFSGVIRTTSRILRFRFDEKVNKMVKTELSALRYKT